MTGLCVITLNTCSINQLLHCIGFYSWVFVLFLFWRGVSRVKIKTKHIRVNKIQRQCNNGFIIYTCVTHHDKKKKRIICSFSWQIGKTKIISREMSPFYLILLFLITTKISKTKNPPPPNSNKKKVVPAITDICKGGQQCKYQLLGSGVNISYYLHGVNYFVIVPKKKMKECRYQ